VEWGFYLVPTEWKQKLQENHGWQEKNNFWKLQGIPNTQLLRTWAKFWQTGHFTHTHTHIQVWEASGAIMCLTSQLQKDSWNGKPICRKILCCSSVGSKYIQHACKYHTNSQSPLWHEQIDSHSSSSALGLNKFSTP